MRATTCLLVLGCLVCFHLFATANCFGQDRTETGFYYPTGTSELVGMADFLAGTPGHRPYADGYLHLGWDIPGIRGETKVSAIADGTVVESHMNVAYYGSDTGDPGGAVLVKHETSVGTIYVLYGHVQPLRGDAGLPGRDAELVAGKPFALVGPYHTRRGSADHLHFGIRRGAPDPQPYHGFAPVASPPNTFGWENPVAFIRTFSPSFQVTATNPTNDANSVSPKVEPSITFSQSLANYSGSQLDLLVSIDPQLLADTVGGRLPGGIRKELSEDRKKIIIRGGYFLPGQTYHIRISKNLADEKGTTLGRDYSFSFTVAKEQIEKNANDLSGRWAGEAINSDGTRYDDKVTLLQAEGKVYMVHRRHQVGSDAYIVLATEDSEAGFLGQQISLGGPPDPRHVLEQEGTWVTATSSKRSLSEDGEDIINEAAFADGIHQTSTWHRVASLGAFPKLDNIVHRFKGTVRLGEEIAAGTLQISEPQHYLLLILNYPGSKLELEVYGPDGQPVTASTPGITYLRNEIPARMYIQNPKQGKWSFKIKGIEVEGDAEPFWLIASYTEKGPDGRVVMLGGGGPISNTTDWQTALLISALVGIFIFGVLCIGVAIRRRTAGCPLPTPGPTAWLQVHSPGVQPFNFPVTKALIRLGRGPGNDIQLTDSKVSTHHAEVRIAGGKAIITDLLSANGTWINGERVEQALLRSRDEVTLGDTHLIVL